VGFRRRRLWAVGRFLCAGGVDSDGQRWTPTQIISSSCHPTTATWACRPGGRCTPMQPVKTHRSLPNPHSGWYKVPVQCYFTTPAPLPTSIPDSIAYRLLVFTSSSLSTSLSAAYRSWQHRSDGGMGLVFMAQPAPASGGNASSPPITRFSAYLSPYFSSSERHGLCSSCVSVTYYVI
jgi:hypothetical protein